MKKITQLLLLFVSILPNIIYSQTITLLEEDFEGVVSGWNTTGNATTNSWIVNTCAGNGTSSAGTQSAYITKGGPDPGCGVTGDIQYDYADAGNGTSEVTILYKTVDASCASNLEFTVDYTLLGEGYPGTPPSILDYGEVVYSTNGGTSWTAITAEFYNIPTWSTATVPIPAVLDGQVFEIGFLWNVDAATIFSPPLAIDNFLVTGEDNTSPVLTCLPDTDVSVGVNCTYIIPDYSGAITVTDNCSATGDITITQSPAAGIAISGHNTTQTITITAEDESGNTSQCTFDITLKDITVPTFNGCTGIAITENLDANCEAEIKDYTNTINVIGDNCTPLNDITVTQLPAPGTVVSGHNELRTIRLYITDNAGNSDSCLFNVTYEDVTAPTLICPGPKTEYVNASCQSILGNYINDISVSDNCTSSPSISVAQNPPPGSTITGNGIHLVTISANDNIGNMSQCTFNVTLIDTIPPSLICPGPQTKAANINCQTTMNDYTGATGPFDNCTPAGSIVITQSPAAGTVVTGPSLPVTLYAEDNSGNIDSCTFTLTLTDSQVPSIVCPPNKDVYVDAGCDYSIEDFTSQATVSDNCTPLLDITVTQSPNSGNTLSSHGTTQVITLTAEDNSGNDNQCQFTITLTDTIAPLINCPGNQNTVVDASCNATVSDYTGLATFSDNCSLNGNITITQSPIAGSTVNSGTHSITLTATDEQGNSRSCSFNLIATDNIVPSIDICPPPTSVPGDANCDGIIPDLTSLTTVSDNCTPSGNITLIQSPTAGSSISNTTNVTITATDLSGNSSTCIVVVSIEDTTAPMITCPGDQTITANSNCEYTIPNYSSLVTVSDNCVGAGSITITQSPVVGTLSSATTTVTMTAEDLEGNISTCTFDVIPTDNTPPVITTCPGLQTYYSDYNCSFTVPDLTTSVIATDACGALTFNQIPAAGTILVNNTGVITVEVIDQSGNISSCDINYQALDTLAPMISCPSDFTSCDTIVTYPMPSAFDGCSNVTITQIDGTGLTNGDDFNLGNYTLEYQAEDTEGNTSTCSFNIEVIIGPSDPDAGSDLLICDEQDAILNANTPVNGVAEWSRILGDGIPNDTYDPNTSVSGLSYGDNIFIWSISLGQCPVKTDTVIISVSPTPTQAVTPEFIETCKDSIPLEGNEAISGNGYWSVLEGSVNLLDSNIYNTVASNYGDTTHLIWHIDGGNCPSTQDTLTVYYFEPMYSADAGLDQELCDTTKIIRLDAPEDQMGYGSWSVISGQGILQDDSLYNSQITNMNRDAVTIFEWSVTDPNCGVTKDRVTISVYSCIPFDFDIPTGFTPDGDGVNDVWEIPQLDKYYPNCTVTILNRWGSEIYRSESGYDNPWDGRYKGKVLPIASYYFVIDFKVDGVEPLTGTVTIIK